jgi:NTE family protein
MAGKIHLRQRIGLNHFISLIGNFGLHHDAVENIIKGKKVWEEV